MNFFKWGEKKIQQFKIWDIAVMKLYLFLVGTVFGTYFSQFFAKYVVVVVVLIGLTAIWLAHKIIKDN